MNKYGVIVRGDLFNISERLKEIDDGYFIVFNRRDKRFEVHNERQRGDTFSLSVPYPSLDARTVELVRRTRVENARKLIEETERENAKLEKKQKQEAIERAAEKAGL